jgi:hypothetical protein
MRAQTTRLISELGELDLFRRLGSQSSLPHKSVPSWEKALESCNSRKWSALQLMIQNRIAGRVNELNWDRYQEWNPVATELRREAHRIRDVAVNHLSSARRITKDFEGSLSWDIIHILLEQEFEDVVAPLFYIPVLLPIYQAGHFPCGWTGPTLDTYWSSSREPIPPGEVLIY